MSFTRQKYDSSCQVEAYQDSLYGGKYALETPLSCDPCFQSNPLIGLQKNGGSISQNEKNLMFRGPIDIESELLNLNQVASKCKIKRRGGMQRSNGVFNPGKTCYFPVDNTRLTNPSSNIRCAEALRLDYPFTDPQANVFFMGQSNVDTRRLVKDNHRPCIEVPHMENNYLERTSMKSNYKQLV